MSRRQLLRRAATLGAALPLAAQGPVFRVDVRLVRLLVTVKDNYGKLVGSLEREDFQVHDNNVEQEIAVFERQSAQPLSIALLVDTSASTAKDLKYEVDSMLRFLKALVGEGHPGDAVSLYSFKHEVTLESGFTRRLDRIERVLRGLKPEAGTSLYDAIYFASRALEMRSGRRVIIVVTDGGDTVSRRSYHDALRAAHSADAPIYSILVMPIRNDAGRNIGGENALTTLGESTGGRVFAPSIGPRLDEAFTEILRDLRTQYLLGYYPRNIPLSKNEFHRVRVACRRPGLRAFTRSGYYGEYEKTGSVEGAGRSGTREKS